MKKIFGLNYGGLQKKMVVLVLRIVIITILLFAGFSWIQDRFLEKVVKEARTEQTQSISKLSEETMMKVLNESMLQTTDLQAGILDSDFSEMVHYVYMIQSMAQDLWENRDSVEPFQVERPNPSKDGQVCAMALSEEGVDPSTSKYLGIIGNLALPMTSIVSHSDMIQAFYVGLADGTHLVIDQISSDKLDENGEPIPLPVRQRPWYTGAAQTGELYFTGVMQDAYNKELCLTASAPILCGEELIGVVGIDISLEKMTQIIMDSSSHPGFSFVVNERGQVVLAPENNGLFLTEAYDKAQDLRTSDNKQLASFIQDSLVGTTHLAQINIAGTDYYLYGSPLPTVGWTFISCVDKAITEAPGRMLLEAYDEINLNATRQYDLGSRLTYLFTIFVLLFIGIIGFFSALLVARRIMRPIEAMTREIQISSTTDNLFEMKDIYRTNDEIEILATAFDDLSKRIKQYIKDITQITKETERVSTELQMANRIQHSMLPNIFPPFPENKEFDIYATMDPAREVGGDFYDFFLIDENHLCMVMADVSGKGVPAALFMMISKVIIQSCAMLGKSAADILTKTNEAICSSNQAEMFVTVWIGILEISTGKIRAANAGHEYPAIMQNGTFDLLKDKHGFVVGGMDGVKYREYEIDLKPGDKLFLYTDGIPEATDPDTEMFGTQRMLDTLNRVSKEDPEKILKSMTQEVKTFVRGAEQFDDMTMLCLKYNGSPEQKD